MTSRQKRLTVMVALALAGLAGSVLPERVSVTLTPSVKHRLWWLSSDLAQVRRGEYVLFHLAKERMHGFPVPEAATTNGDLRAIKRVGCDEGEVLRREGRDYYCGGEFLGHAKERSKKGEPMPHFQFSGMIPPGRAFLVGDHPDSFDSRYFGLVEKGSYRAWARALF